MKRKSSTTLVTKLPEFDSAESMMADVTLPEPFHTQLVPDNDLSNYGIDKGDVVILYPTNVIHENQIMKISSQNFYDLGFAYDNFGEICVAYKDGFIHNKQERWNKNPKLEMYVVVGIIKPFCLKEDAPIQTKVDKTEHTFVCEECKKTMTGSRKFLSSMGWRIRKDSVLCVACW